MLTRLDRYIIVKFLSTFFFALTLIISVAIVIDLAEKIDDFIQNKATTKQLIFDYYIFFIPWFYNLFNNLFVFIAVIFFTSRLAQNSELVAMLAGGVSFWRLFRPYLIGAIILAILGYLMTSWVIPYCNEKKVDFENQYINGRRNEEHWHKNVHRQLEPGAYLFIENFSKRDSLGYRFTLERFNGRELSSKLTAEKFGFNRETGKWRVSDYFERSYVGGKEVLKRGVEMDIDITFNPQEFFLRKDDVGIYNNAELNRVIAAERMRGAEKIEFYLVEKYRRVALPFSTIILTLIGFSISSRKVKGGRGMHIGFGLGLAFSFIFVGQLTFTFAYSGAMSPLLAVWFPNILYLFIGIMLYRFAPK